MKKFKIILLALLGILFLTSCGGNKNSSEDKNIGEKNKVEEEKLQKKKVRQNFLLPEKILESLMENFLNQKLLAA